MAATPVQYGMLDHSNEKTSVQVYFPEIDSDGGNWADLFTGLGNSYDLVKTAIAAVSDLNFTRSTASVVVDESSPSIPSATTAQREVAVRIHYSDTVTNGKFRFDIPGPATAFIPTGTDEYDLSNIGVAALIAVLEANLVSPDGNAITVNSMRFVGRNS